MSSTALSEIPGWYIEFQAALLRQAPRPGEIDQVTAEGWAGNQKGLKKNLAGCLLPPPVVVSGTAGKFVAKEKFAIDTSRKASVKISYLGDNFRSWFLTGLGKIEDVQATPELTSFVLETSMLDKDIIAKIGDETKAETSLTEVYDLMTKQPNGEDGTLLNNGWANIFYIKDQNGVLRAVRVRWRGDGWYVDALSVESPGAWDDGLQVFSRNSVLTSSETKASAKA